MDRMNNLTSPLGGAGLILPGRRIVQAGLGAGPQSKYSLGFASASSQYVTVGSLGILDATLPFTLSAWFKTTSNGAELEIYTQGHTNITPLLALTISTGLVDFGVRTDASVISESTSVAKYNDGIWHHVAAVRRTTSPYTEIYVDGVSKGISTTNPSGAITFSKSRIGVLDRSSKQGYFNGNIDDVCLFASALTVPQIAALAAGTLDPATLTTAGLWRFEEGTGTTAADSSGNGNTGTLTNGPTWSTDVPTQLQ